ncbi:MULTISPECIES: RloB family protein [unclassified Anabaena]|uniref:RloB family protein n=1 Tax=unclassified Anabaena TaxID=2619674 RepID=UPI001446D069|nr:MULTISPECIES: RloB family protein [unclassified Anabaena]MTJ09094.1 RloB domain-containing protein [Anabaena sp. UHCC 0204]MTJ52200.1 RloB domain-containing protein [Anabaena sp. UHCC 0253]
MGRQRNTDYQGRSSYIAGKCGEDGKWKLYIIAAEGDKTEYQYFNALTTKYEEDFRIGNIHVEYIDREEENACNSDPRYVYQTLLQFSQELEKKYNLTEYDELWIIIDTDDYNNRKQTISDIAKKCYENPIYKLCISNPCFEIWLILHFFDLETNLQNAGILEITEFISLKNYIQNQYIKKRPGICKKIWNMIHQSKKQPSFTKIIEYIPEAISRSKMLDELNINDPDYPEHKIGTEVYKLVDKLIKLSINLEI